MTWQTVEPTPEEVAKSRERYSERIAVYRRHGHDREMAMRFVIDCAEQIHEPVLDIGAGKGFAAVELAKRGIKVVSVDISDEELRAAFLNSKAFGVDSLIEFHLVDANHLPFESEHFHLVTMINVLHHLDDFSGILREVSRVLAPGGKFLVAEFTKEGFDILDEIHRLEGRVHPRRSLHGIDDIAAELPDHHLQCCSRDTRFHEYVMIAEKI